jgi:hypothetical protein
MAKKKAICFSCGKDLEKEDRKPHSTYLADVQQQLLFSYPSKVWLVFRQLQTT